MSKTMSENRESLELNGVTFYFVRNENYYMAKICNDIDIEAGTEEVTFEFDKIGTYELMDNKKVFPEVKILNIKKWGRNLRIPNSMFPNVTKVVVDWKQTFYQGTQAPSIATSVNLATFVV